MRARIGKRLLASIQPNKDKPFDVWDTETPGFLLRVEPSGYMSYFIRYRKVSDGKRSRYFIGNTQVLTPELARDEAKTKLAGLLAGTDPGAARAARRVTIPTLEEFIEQEYAPEVLATRKSGAVTIARIRGSFAGFLDTPLNELTLRAMEKWRGERLKKGRMPTTVNRDLSALRACLSKAVYRDILPAHPLAKLRPLKEDRSVKVRYLVTVTTGDTTTDVDEEAALMNALDAREEKVRSRRDSHNAFCRERGYAEWPDLRKVVFADHLRPMVILSLHTGLRRGELFSVEWSDIDLDGLHPILTVQGKKAKGGTTRHIPLNSVARETLRQWKAQTSGEGLVFATKGGVRFDNVNTSWERVLGAAKILDFRWHDMRHHFASKLVMAGVDLNTVRELLGHTSITMTLRYSHLAPQTKAAAVERLVHPPSESKILNFPKSARKARR